MKQVFFDANVWIEYCWRRHFVPPHKKPKKNSIPINNVAGRKMALVISEPLLYEITKHFKDYYLFKKILPDGFGSFEFSRVRRRYKLDTQDKEEVNKIYQLVVTTPVARKNILVNWLDEKTFERVYRLINGYHFEMLDCLHLVAAEKAACEVFVTKDEELIRQAKDAQKTFRKLKNIDFIRPATFRTKYSHLFRK